MNWTEIVRIIIVENLNSAVACAVQRGNAITALSGYQACAASGYQACAASA